MAELSHFFGHPGRMCEACGWLFPDDVVRRIRRDVGCRGEELVRVEQLKRPGPHVTTVGSYEATSVSWTMIG